MNNEEVIEYVRTTSNHPHAEKIIEWLLTGCVVKYWHDYDNKWKETTTPGWDKDTKYILFKPKPAKPAYKSYLYKGKKGKEKIGHIFYKYKENESIIQNEANFICWLSKDWIEYDPPKKWPTPLIERIAAIDIKAAEWIVDNWDDFSFKNKNAEKLHFMFVWKDAPQGGQCWENISKELGE